MNNILDYSHMIKTYVMVKEFNTANTDSDETICKCDKSFECFQIKELKVCKYNKKLLNNLPLFKILINPDIKTKFILSNKFKESKLDVIDFIKILLYIIKFKDESIDYLLNKKYVKCITLLSVYILIFNNYNILKNIMYLFEPLIINIKNNLKDNYINNEDNIYKLKKFFKKYIKQTPNDCINIMKNWDVLLDELIMLD
jgi:hypothetical protein